MAALAYAYKPRSAFIPFHNRRQRRAMIVIHRRAGKTVAAVNDLLIGGLECPLPRPQFAYIAPTYVMAKRIAWDYAKDYGRPLMPPNTKPNESELRIDVMSRAGTPARLFLAGADNPDSLRGIYLDGAVVDEKALIPPYVTSQILLPALADRQGWLVEMGTPKGRNHFYDAWQKALTDPECYTLMLRASESGIIPPEELAVLKANMEADEYEQEMECSFTATAKGLILFKELITARNEGRVSPDLHPLPLSLSPIIATLDIGFRDMTAAWLWQIRPGGFRLVGYIEYSGLDADDWVDLLYKRQVSSVYLPHDARARFFATKHSSEEVFRRSRRFKVNIIPSSLISDRINAARIVLPFCDFCESEPEVKLGISRLENWTFSYNQDLQVFSRDPQHDINSHGSDSFSYGAQVLGYHVKEAQAMRDAMAAKAENKDPRAMYNFNLDQLFDDHRRGYV